MPGIVFECALYSRERDEMFEPWTGLIVWFDCFHRDYLAAKTAVRPCLTPYYLTVPPVSAGLRRYGNDLVLQDKVKIVASE
jgi:hypothetical protein